MVRAKVLELRNNLSRFLKRVEAGEEVVVCRRNQQIALICPIGAVRRGSSPKFKLGWMRGRGKILGDLVAPVMAIDEWEATRR